MGKKSTWSQLMDKAIGVIDPALAAAVPTTAVIVNTPSNVIANTAFVMSGTLSGFPSAPTLSYADNPTLGPVTGVKMTATTKNSVTLSWIATPISWKPLPSGSTVTNGTFSFSHPALPTAGSVVTDVTDGNVVGKATYTVTATPVVTPTTIVAELNAIQVALNKVILDVWKLTP